MKRRAHWKRHTPPRAKLLGSHFSPRHCITRTGDDDLPGSVQVGRTYHFIAGNFLTGSQYRLGVETKYRRHRAGTDRYRGS